MKKEAAQFTYYGADETRNRTVKFYKNRNGMYVCEIEGVPSLTITHPSYERVKSAFEGWYQMAWKDWGPSEIDWGDMGTPADHEKFKMDKHVRGDFQRGLQQ